MLFFFALFSLYSRNEWLDSMMWFLPLSMHLGAFCVTCILYHTNGAVTFPVLSTDSNFVANKTTSIEPIPHQWLYPVPLKCSIIALQTILIITYMAESHGVIIFCVLRCGIFLSFSSLFDTVSGFCVFVFCVSSVTFSVFYTDFLKLL